MSASVMNNSNSGLRWFHFTGPCGSAISCKGPYEQKARAEAADRLNCEEEQLVCTGWDPYYSKYVL